MQSGGPIPGAARVTALDFEGTPASGIVEYGMASLLSDGSLECFTGFCAPRGQWTGRDASLTGISKSSLQSAASFEEQWPLFRQYRQEGPLVAHHAAVEDRLLRQYFPLAGSVPDWSGGANPVVTWGPWIDTLRIWERLSPGLAQYDLGFLIRWAGLTEQLQNLAEQHCPRGRCTWHCALYDALACLLLWMAAVRFAPETSASGWFHLSRGHTSDDRFQQGELFT